MSKTYWDLKSKVWTLLGQKSTSTLFSPTIVWDAINSKVLDFLRGRITSVLDPNRIYRSWKIWIREWSTYLRTIANSSSSAITAVWAVSISCDTTNLNSSGWIEIWGEQVSYTSKNSTTLLWVTWITIEHASWTNIVQLFTMPANLEKPIAVYLLDEVTWNTIWEIPLNRENRTVWYEIIKISSTNLLKFYGLDSNSFIEVRYSGTYTPMVNDSDICVIPDHYWDTVIASIVAGEFGIDKWIPNAQNIIIKWYANLQNCYAYFNNETNGIQQSIKPKSYWFSSLKRRTR